MTCTRGQPFALADFGANQGARPHQLTLCERWMLSHVAAATKRASLTLPPRLSLSHSSLGFTTTAADYGTGSRNNIADSRSELNETETPFFIRFFPVILVFEPRSTSRTWYIIAG